MLNVVSTSTFRIDFLRTPFVVLGIAAFATAAWSLYYVGPWGLLVAAPPIAIVTAIGWHFGVVQVSELGITLYRTTKIEWSGVSRLKTRCFLGLPYLLVWRQWPWPEFVPLYTLGDESIVSAFVRYAPPGTVAATWLQNPGSESPPKSPNAA